MSTLEERAPHEGGALGPYVRAISRHGAIVVVIASATLAASAAWLAARDASYEATADVLVTPLAQDELAFVGVQILRESNEPERTMQTAASLLDTRAAAEIAAPRLGQSVSEVEDATDVEPKGESTILAVTARGGTARRAAAIANTFTDAALAARRDALTKQVAPIITQLRRSAIAQQRQEPEEQNNEVLLSLRRRLNELRLVRSGVDPTLSLAQPAVEPESSSGPATWLVLLLSAMAGLTLGLVTALVVEAATGRPLGPVAED